MRLSPLIICYHLILLIPIAAAAERTDQRNAIPAKGNPSERIKFNDRVSLGASYQVTLGTLKEAIPKGLEIRLAYDVRFNSFWRLGEADAAANPAWFPWLRFEIGYLGYGGLPGEINRSVTGVTFATGPLWLFRPFMEHSGYIVVGGVAGIALSRVQGPVVDLATNLFTVSVFTGYEYPVGGIRLLLQTRGTYMADLNDPLFSVGGALGITRELSGD